MISREAASRMQSDIMKLAHTYKTGAYIDRAAIKQAADVIAQREGYKSGQDLQRQIGARTQNIKKKLSASAQQQNAGKAAPDLVERYINLIHDNYGSVPLDWLLLREWTDVSATELRHARKGAIKRGYKQIKAKGGSYIFELPEQPKPQPPATNGAVETQQAALPLDGDDVVSLLRTIVTRLDEVIKEQRQLRAITANAWKS